MRYPRGSQLWAPLTRGFAAFSSLRRNDAAETGYAGVNYAGVGNGRGGGGGDGYGYLGMVYANGDGRGRRALPTLPLASSVITLVALGCLRLL